MSDTAKTADAVSTSPSKPKPAMAEQQTSSHIVVQPLYTPVDLAEANYDRDLGYPGEFPYTRGVQATMYRGRLWTMRQYAGMGDAEESNKRYKYLLANGTTGLSVAFDLPTQIGLDSDNPLAAGEVGKVGVAIDSIEDMQRLFDGIELTKISTSMTINASASILLALYVAVARRQGMDIRKLSGTIQNDVLKEYIARGTYIYPPQQAMRIITDIFAWTNETCRTGTRFPSRAITCARRDRPPCRRSRLRWATGLPTWKRPSRLGWMSTSSRRDSPSFLTPTAIFWKKLRSFGRRGACGRRSCATNSRLRIRSRGCYGFTRRPRGRR